MAEKKIAIADIEPLVEKFNGNVAAIARALGVNRSTVWARVQESTTLKAALDNAREAMLDNAESVLYRKVLEGSTAELIFFLKTQGKRRGYTERQEHEHSGPNGQPIEFTVQSKEQAQQELAQWRKQQQEMLNGSSALLTGPILPTNTQL
jgi:hypothetical protein